MLPMARLRDYGEKELGVRIARYFAQKNGGEPKRGRKKELESYTNFSSPVTVSGLASFLGVSRQELLGFAAESEPVARALRKIEAYTEEQLLSGKAATGIIFCLRANFAWKEQELYQAYPAADFSGLALEDLRRLAGFERQE